MGSVIWGAADAELCEIERLAEEIRLKVSGAHLNFRVVWIDTVVPCLEAARSGVSWGDVDERRSAARHTLLQALRDVAGAL